MSRCRVLGKGGCLGLRKSSEWQPVWPDTYGCAGILRIYRFSVYYSGQWGIYGRTSAGDNFDQQMDPSLKSGGGSGDTELAPGKQTNWVVLMFFTVAFAQYLCGFAGGRVVGHSVTLAVAVAPRNHRMSLVARPSMAAGDVLTALLATVLPHVF
jgi:hypothetical protein